MTRIGDNARPIVEAALRRAALRADGMTRRRLDAERAFQRMRHPEEDPAALPSEDWTPARRAARERFRRAHVLEMRTRDYAAGLEIELANLG